MKHSKKLLTILSGISLAVTSVTPIITSCSNYDKMVQPLKEETIKQFKALAQFGPHYSGEEEDTVGSLVAIKAYYKDIVENKFKLKWVQQEDKTDGTGVIEYQGNCYFDIPATSGHENDPMIILQGHIDMVESHNEVKVPEFDKKTYKIKLVESTDQNGRPIIHSEDYASSIGADDGIGVATILAFAAKRNEFEHGAIRCLLTTDEETGMYGAINIPHDDNDTKYGNWFREDPKDKTSKLIMNLLNVDNEEIEGTPIASAGGNDYQVYIEDLSSYLISYTSTDKCYVLKAEGFRGGHSMLYDKTYGSAIHSLLTILNEYLDSDETNEIKLSQIECDCMPNQIADKATINFSTSSDVKADITKLIENELDNISKNCNEPNAKITIEETTTKPTKVVKGIVGKALISMLNSWWCGCLVPEEYIKNWTSANIAPVYLYTTKPEDFNTPYFQADTLYRSFNKATIKILAKACDDAVDDAIKLAKDEALEFDFAGINSEYDPWLPADDNPLRKILVDGYKSANITPKEYYTTGGLECSWWFKYQPTINIATTGPTVINAHTYNETLYVDTLDPLMQIVLYTVQHLN
ncbi:MAG: M20/M25/M40 family metallo-hydrolase [Malacoplasma sp.]|nr:M20/M25/M40 family metallo-hydrolase [Malacoplasma sp.]